MAAHETKDEPLNGGSSVVRQAPNVKKTANLASNRNSIGPNHLRPQEVLQNQGLKQFTCKSVQKAESGETSKPILTWWIVGGFK